MLAIPLLSFPVSGAIVGISSGDTRLGAQGSNLILNGSFENRSPGTAASPTDVCVSGTPGLRDATCASPNTSANETIPNWTVTGSDGSYAQWGNIIGRRTQVPADGSMMVYFGNWFTNASTSSTVDSSGIVTYSSAPTFTNNSSRITDPVTVSQTVAGLDTSQVYLLDFWTHGEWSNDTNRTPGVFGVSITGENMIFLRVPRPDRWVRRSVTISTFNPRFPPLRSRGSTGVIRRVPGICFPRQNSSSTTSFSTWRQYRSHQPVGW